MYKIVGGNPATSTRYVPINGKVFKIACSIQASEVWAADALLGKIAEKALIGAQITPPTATIDITEATEAELVAEQKTHPSITLPLENLISYMKASNAPPREPAAPLRVEIVNPEQIAGPRDTVVEVRRNAAGQLTGATAHKV